MTKEELNNELLKLKKEFERKEQELKIKYCNAHNPYKVGDIFTDHIGSIIIEKIGYYFAFELSCTYFGAELKKDGTLRKDGSKRSAHQTNDFKLTKK